MIDTEWMGEALCASEGNAAAWASEHKPSRRVLSELKQICDRCPVRAQCAAWALKSRADAGCYAGVWLPKRTRCGYISTAWLASRELLERAYEAV